MNKWLVRFSALDFKKLCNIFSFCSDKREAVLSAESDFHLILAASCKMKKKKQRALQRWRTHVICIATSSLSVCVSLCSCVYLLELMWQNDGGVGRKGRQERNKKQTLMFFGPRNGSPLSNSKRTKEVRQG